MRCHQHSTSNMLLGANGIPNCDTIPATMVIDEDQSVRICTYWRPSPEELEALNRGHTVCLHVIGNLHPPVAITVEGP